MPSFEAQLRFRLAADSLEACGPALRGLQEVARAAGFDLIEVRVEPASAAEDASAAGRHTDRGSRRARDSESP